MLIWRELKGVTVTGGTSILAVAGVSRSEVSCSKLVAILLLPIKKKHHVDSRIEKRYMAPFFGSLYMPGIISGHTVGVLQTLVQYMKCASTFLRMWKKSHPVIYKKFGHFIHYPSNTGS
jgi:hypothetical protein